MSSRTRNLAQGMDPKKQGGQVVAAQHEISISGPLPVAQEFAGYEAAHKGSADRILAMAETEASRRQRDTRLLVIGQTFQQFAGPVFGFAVAVLALVFGYKLAMADKELMGFSSLIVGAASMIGSFIAALRKPKP